MTIKLCHSHYIGLNKIPAKEELELGCGYNSIGRVSLACSKPWLLSLALGLMALAWL